AELKPRCRGQRGAQDRATVLVLSVDPGHNPVAIELLDLVAIHRIVEEEGEVGDQVELVVLPEGLDLDGIGIGQAPTKFGVPIEALSVAALTVVDSTESFDETEADGPLGNFPRSEPVAREVRPPHRDVDVLADGRRGLGESVYPFVILRPFKRAVRRV